ncbi:citrate lyase subunit alpha [uncultured Ilyobacter sp.]|jgi:citrate lyase subunit alpha/citrate CoA-transferase|uniref:citrate lyase subunit alpha n=1 Tax=uncultured Ilyobacter sp. TaxID=544433 RepID=UPI0029C016BE|nr:citrate lyase subunit alpha [uncultured Ilyobacter sp.]
MELKTLVNKLGREMPSFIEGYGEVKPYAGPFATKASGRKYAPSKSSSKPGDVKLLSSLKEALEKVEIKDGMTISFHHHLRNGDYVLNMVVEEIAAMGIKDITICSSSLTSAHEPLIDHIKNGVITGLQTSGLRGKIAKEVATNNILGKPVVFRTHGGRARAVEAGEVKIDVAFIAAPSCDPMGNMNGKEGKSAFGAMGYPMVDAEYAEKVVAITDNLMPFPLAKVSIPMTLVDHVVEVESIGDPAKIATGATRVTKNPMDLLIAENAAKVLIASGLVKEGFSFQAGSGGASLAVCKFIREYMEKNEIKGSFAAGGVTAYLVELLEAGLFNALLDTQTFDGAAADSFNRNPNHIEMSASMYANPHNKSCSAHQLDMMILSATEIDTDFNLNSMTGSTGMIMGAQGGAPDTAAGAKLTVCVAPTMRKRIPILLDKVTNIVTPGETVDVLVTERGTCVNPLRTDLIEKFTAAGIDLMTIEELKSEVEKLTGIPERVQYEDTVVGIIEYRDGTVTDVIKQVKK